MFFENYPNRYRIGRHNPDKLENYFPRVFVFIFYFVYFPRVLTSTPACLWEVNEHVHIQRPTLSIFTWVTNTSNEHVQNQTLHLSSLSLNRTRCLSKLSKWNSAKLFNGLPASALVSPPPTLSFPSLFQHSSQRDLKM